MNNEPTLVTSQSKLLELRRFLNRVSDISLSFRDLKDRIYQEHLPVEDQITEYQKLVNEMMSYLNTNSYGYKK